MESINLIVILFYLTSTAFYAAYFIKQKDFLHHIGYYLLFTGFFIHIFGIGTQYTRTGIFPAGNLKENLSIAGGAVAGVFLLLKYKFNLKILGTYTAPLSAIVMIISFFLPGYPSEPNIVFKNFWLITHVSIIFIGEASFALACGAGMLYLAQEHAIKTKNHGYFYKRLPSLDLIDSTGYACIVVGFTLLTIGLIIGSIYAKSVWGRFWSWDPKEVWSMISWLLYAALLHQRLTMGWRGRRAAIMSIVGFAALMFTFFGVNFLLTGHHGEFTK
ncbi:MAG: c-type cytochrome biogenesis protein CcsB [Desulfobacterium sp.]|nr:c-type cytochrome biogenesis protein CcsB [Desulfobacterium sp.]